MTQSTHSKTAKRRVPLKLWVAAGVAVTTAVVGLAWMSAREKALEEARARAGVELAAFERCFLGAPLGPGESMADRTRGVELAIAIARAEQDPDKDEVPTDAAPGSRWPMRCAVFADALGRTLSSEPLRRDPRVAALRDALPTRARLELPYALLRSEGADLAAARTAAALPAPNEAPTNEAPPAPLAPPLASPGLSPLGKGVIPFPEPEQPITSATEALETRALHFLIPNPSSAVGERMCELDEGDPKGPYATAKCGELPPDFRSDVRLANREEGSPLALIASKRTGGEGKSSTWEGGVVISWKGSPKALPVPSGASGVSAYINKDGAYMVVSSAYLSFVRIGEAAKITTTDLTQTPTDHETAQALPPNVLEAAPAYGHVFWMDPPSYGYGTSPRSLYTRKVFPSLSGGAQELGRADHSYLRLLAGCQSDGRKALLIASTQVRRKNSDGTFEKRTFPVVIAEGDGPYQRFDAEILDSAPHLRCAKDAAIITSTGAAKDPGFAVVSESHCTSKGCVTRTSEPIAIPSASRFDAVTTDGGVVLVWKVRADLVASPARGMVFYRSAPLDKIAGVPPRPLLENKRGGGLDVDAFHVVGRGPAAIVALESGGKTPITYAVKIDAAGAPSPIQVEETKW